MHYKCICSVEAPVSETVVCCNRAIELTGYRGASAQKTVAREPMLYNEIVGLTWDLPRRTRPGQYLGSSAELMPSFKTLKPAYAPLNIYQHSQMHDWCVIFLPLRCHTLALKIPPFVRYALASAVLGHQPYDLLAWKPTAIAIRDAENNLVCHTRGLPVNIDLVR